MDILPFLDRGISSHRDVLGLLLPAVSDSFRDLAEICRISLRQGGKILFCGNGGSAADSQHLAAEMVIRFTVNRTAIPAIALTTDSSVLTACGNDLSFDEIFSRQVEAIARSGDVLIAISTSGNSPNIIRALNTAKAMGATAAGISGKGGGAMRGIADPLVIVPSDITARIQEMHILLGHVLCEIVEQDYL